MSKLRTNYKPIEVQVTAANISTDGGLLLLKQEDKRFGLTRRMASCVSETRRGEVDHTIPKMLAQRVYGIAMGWEDCNDFTALRHDELYALSLESTCASQPTLSRFENSVGYKDLYRMSNELAQIFVDRYERRPPRRIVLDIDATVDPAHGQQQFEYFNGFYGCTCYLPLLVFGSCDGAPMEILAAVLRPGNVQSAKRAAAILRRLARRLKEAFPKTKILVRGDAGFGIPEFFSACEDLGLEYLVAMQSNEVLHRLAEPLMAQARTERDRTGQTSRCIGETLYGAKSWGTKRRVIIKAEALSGKVNSGKNKPGKDNARFVVTNLSQDPEKLYGIYCLRGESENRIKELKLDLLADRTSCTSFTANAFRLLLHATAFALLTMVRDLLIATEMAKCTMGQIRLKLLKIAALVERSTRRLLVRLPRGHPHVPLLLKILEV